MRLDNPSISGSISYLGGGTNTLSGTSANITGSFTGSFIGEVSGTSTNALTASYVELSNVDGSASLATRLENQENFSSSLDATFATEAELNAATSSLSSSLASDISTNSSSIASLESVSGSYANSASFASDISTNSSSIASLESVSGSYANSSSFASDISANSASIGSLNAASSSYLLNTTDTLTGDLTVTGEVVAQTLHVQQVTSSIVYSSGSNVFGENVSDTQKFTGSLQVSGSTNYLLGDVGIGTTSMYSNGLTIQGSSDDYSLTIAQSNASNAGYGFKSDTSGHFSLARYAGGSFGSPALFVQLNTNNIGIGTQTPNQKLHVEGRSLIQGSAGYLFDVQTTDANKPRLQVYVDDTNGVHLISGYDTTAKPMSFYTSGSERMRIDSSGKAIFKGDVDMESGLLSVGQGNNGENRIEIGKDRTTDGYAYIDFIGDATYTDFGLRIIRNNGGANTSSQILHRGTGELNLQTVDSSPITFSTAGSPRMLINSSGNVGIGTTSPSSTLHLKDNFASGIAITFDRTELATVDSLFYAGVSTAGSTATDFMFLGTGTTHLSLAGTGNVGIGTTTNQGKLDVHNTGAASILYVSSDVSNNSTTSILNLGGASGRSVSIQGYRGASSNEHDLVFKTYSSGQYERMRIDKSGNVDIGTGGAGARNSRLLLQNGGDQGAPQLMLIDSDTSGRQAEIRFNNDNLIYEYWNGSSRSERMRIDGSGNVGIGTTSPNVILHAGSTGTNAYSSTITKGSNMKGIVNTVASNGDDMVGIYFGTGTTTEGTHWSGITGARSDNASHWGTQLNFYTHNNDVANLNDATQKMVIMGDGNVGIGTTSPDYGKLNIWDTTAGSSIRTIADITNGTDVNINIKLTNVGHSSPYAEIASYLTTPLVFQHAQGGNVGIGTTSPTAKLQVLGTIAKGGTYPIYEYSKAYANLGTSGNDVAGLTSSTNGQSAMFIFQGQGGSNADFHIVYHCTNQSGNWYWNKRTVYLNNNIDVSATASGSSTITFTVKSTSGTLSYTPLIMIRCMGTAINTSYFN